MSIEDKAQELEAAAWEQNNSARTAPRQFSPDDQQYGPAACDECEDDMPNERRARGARLCTPCQELHERRARLFRRP